MSAYGRWREAEEQLFEALVGGLRRSRLARSLRRTSGVSARRGATRSRRGRTRSQRRPQRVDEGEVEGGAR